MLVGNHFHGLACSSHNLLPSAASLAVDDAQTLGKSALVIYAFEADTSGRQAVWPSFSCSSQPGSRSSRQPCNDWPQQLCKMPHQEPGNVSGIQMSCLCRRYTHQRAGDGGRRCRCGVRSPNCHAPQTLCSCSCSPPAAICTCSTWRPSKRNFLGHLLPPCSPPTNPIAKVSCRALVRASVKIRLSFVVSICLRHSSAHCTLEVKGPRLGMPASWEFCLNCSRIRNLQMAFAQ